MPIDRYQPSPLPERPHTFIKRVYLLLLRALGFVPLIGMLLGLRLPFAAVENRALMKKPEVTFSGVFDTSYFAALSAYFNDHFGFRESFIALKYELDAALLRKSRKELIIGEDGFTFYSSFANQYTKYASDTYPYERWNKVLLELGQRAAKDKKTVILETFRNKEFIYRDKLPSVWRDRVAHSKNELPMIRVEKAARKAGIAVIEHTNDFDALRKEGVPVYSTLHEHHPTSQAFFAVVREVISKIAALEKLVVSIPDNYPQYVSSAISVNRVIDTKFDIGDEYWITDASRYRSANYVNTDYPNKRVWTRVTFPSISPEHGQFEYVGNGIFPATSVWGDSFFKTYSTQFGDLFLPFFKELQFWAIQSGPDAFNREWKKNDIIMISFADQNSGGFLTFLEAALEKDRN